MLEQTNFETDYSLEDVNFHLERFTVKSKGIVCSIENSNSVSETCSKV